MACSASRKKKCLTVRNLSIKLYRVYVCYTNITLYHVLYIYSVPYYPRFHVTVVGPGTYYPPIRGSNSICLLSLHRYKFTLAATLKHDEL
jgi:hypothetical protein